jgi:hypothetical protein
MHFSQKACPRAVGLDPSVTTGFAKKDMHKKGAASHHWLAPNFSSAGHSLVGQQALPLPQPARSANDVFAAPVAQLDRALPSEGRGREFESRRARQQIQRVTDERHRDDPE